MFFIVLIPIAAALACVLSGSRRLAEYTTVASSVAVSVVALLIAAEAIDGTVIVAFGGSLRIDALSAYLVAIISLLSLAAAAYSVEYMRADLSHGALDERKLRQYYTLFNIFVATMLMVPLANNLALLWIAIEATTLVSALLVGLYRKKESIEAAWKYIMLCTVGITFALLGTFILYHASTGVMGEGKGVLEWSELHRMARSMNPATVKLAFLLVMVGYGTKAGLAPVHNWLPDAHSEAPTPISALLSGILLNCAFYGVMRFASVADKACGHEFILGVMTFFGLASIVVASIFMLIQTNAKRLLAYSSIEHMGIIALSFGVGGAYGLYAALLHILNHAMGKPLMFFITGRVKTAYHSVETDEVKGLLKVAPLTGALCFVGFLALAGAPPFSMFISEFLMFRGLADSGRWVVVAVFLTASGLVFYGLLRSFGGMSLGPKPEKTPDFQNSMGVSLVMVSLGAGLLFLGVHIPDSLDRLITLSVGALGG